MLHQEELLFQELSPALLACDYCSCLMFNCCLFDGSRPGGQLFGTFKLGSIGLLVSSSLYFKQLCSCVHVNSLRRGSGSLTSARVIRDSHSRTTTSNAERSATLVQLLLSVSMSDAVDAGLFTCSRDR